MPKTKTVIPHVSNGGGGTRQAQNGQRLIRKTIVLDSILNKYLEGLSRRDAQPQSEILRVAFRFYLTEKERFNLDNAPTVKVTMT